MRGPVLAMPLPASGFGCGCLLESIYEECLSRELSLRDIPFARQLSLPIEYKGQKLDCPFRLDLLVASSVVVEIKAVSRRSIPRNC